MKKIIKVTLLSFLFFFSAEAIAQQLLVNSGGGGPTVWNSFNLPTPVGMPGTGTVITSYTGEPAGWKTAVPPWMPAGAVTTVDALVPPSMWVPENNGVVTEVYGALFRTNFNLASINGSFYMNVRPNNQCEVFINGNQVGGTYNWTNNLVQVCIPNNFFLVGNNKVAIKTTEWIDAATTLRFDLWNDVSEPTIAPNDQIYCVTNPPALYSGSPIGGVWSGAGMDANGFFTPSNANIGNNHITYTVNLGFANCPTSVFVNGDVFDTANIAIDQTDATYCSDDEPINYNATPAGGTWSGTGITAGGVFTPSSANMGSNILTYSFVDGPCLTTKTVNATVEECCREIVGNEVAYQQTLFTGDIDKLKTISTVISGDKIYSVHQNIDLIPNVSPAQRYNEMVLTIQDMMTGNLISSWKYTFTKNGDISYVFSKEIQVVEDGGNVSVFVLANTSRLSFDGDNSSYSSLISGILMEINASTGSISLLNNKEVPFSGITIDKEPDNIFFNSFSPYYENDKLEGWIIVGSVRLKVNNHYRMIPALLRTDAQGNNMDSKFIEFDILCATCNWNEYRVESNWAVDISRQVGYSSLKYAVLLESRDNFNGIVGHTANNIRMSYIFVDENLNINMGYASPIKWWSSIGGINLPLNPRKIRYDLDNSGNPSIKIVGQYTNNSKGFIAQFNGSGSTGLYNYNATDSKEVLETFGLVDIAFNNSKYYVLGNHRLLELDQNLNFLNSSEKFDSPIFTGSDFHVFNNYIGNLIHVVPFALGNPTQSGFIINDVNSQTYRKLTDNLYMTCGNPLNIPLFKELELVEILSEFDPQIPSIHLPELTKSEHSIVFDSDCCLMRSKGENQNDGSSNQLFAADFLETNEYLVSPNPANEKILISNSKNITEYDNIRIMNLNGKVVLEKNNSNASSLIDISSLNSSVYIIEITSKNNIEKQRLVVTK